MPWKEINVMNQRTEFVLKTLQNALPFDQFAGNTESAAAEVLKGPDTNGKTDLSSVAWMAFRINPASRTRVRTNSTKASFAASSN